MVGHGPAGPDSGWVGYGPAGGWVGYGPVVPDSGWVVEYGPVGPDGGWLVGAVRLILEAWVESKDVM